MSIVANFRSLCFFSVFFRCPELNRFHLFVCHSARTQAHSSRFCQPFYFQRLYSSRFNKKKDEKCCVSLQTSSYITAKHSFRIKLQTHNKQTNNEKTSEIEKNSQSRGIILVNQNRLNCCRCTCCCCWFYFFPFIYFVSFFSRRFIDTYIKLKHFALNDLCNFRTDFL